MFLAPDFTDDDTFSKIRLTKVMTDNRGSGYCWPKMATNRYSLSAIVMEMALPMRRRGLAADVSWLPREYNSHADALANGNFEHFSPDRCVIINFIVHPLGHPGRRHHQRGRVREGRRGHEDLQADGSSARGAPEVPEA